jgi:hypothetical protein
MTIQWLLIVITSARLYVPIAAYDTQTECAAALEAMRAMPPERLSKDASLDCVLVTIDPSSFDKGSGGSGPRPPPRRRRR